MRRAKPRQHRRKLKSGKTIIVNKGRKKKRRMLNISKQDTSKERNMSLESLRLLKGAEDELNLRLYKDGIIAVDPGFRVPRKSGGENVIINTMGEISQKQFDDAEKDINQDLRSKRISFTRAVDRKRNLFGRVRKDETKEK